MSSQKQELSDNNNNDKQIGFLTEEQEKNIRDYIREHIEEIANFKIISKHKIKIFKNIKELKITKKEEESNLLKLIITPEILEKIIKYIAYFNHHHNLVKANEKDDVTAVTDSIVNKCLPKNITEMEFSLLQHAILNLVVLLHLPQQSPYLTQYKTEVSSKDNEGKTKTEIVETITENGFKMIKDMAIGYIGEEISHLENPENYLSDKVFTLTKEIQSLTAGIKTWETKYQQKDEEYMVLEVTNQKLQTQLTAYNSEIEKIRPFFEEHKKLKEQLDNYTTNSRDFKNQDESESLKRKIDDLSTSNSNLTKEVLELRHENSQLKEEKQRKKPIKRRKLLPMTGKTLEPIIKDLIFFMCSTYNHALKKNHSQSIQKKHPRLHNDISKAAKSNVTTILTHDLGNIEDKLFWFLNNRSKSDNADVCDNTGWTLLHIASLLGDTKSVTTLLERDVDYKTQTNESDVAFTLAVRNKHSNIIKIFFEKKINFETKLSQKIRTVLNDCFQYAVNHDNEEMVEIFLKNHGALDHTHFFLMLKTACRIGKISILESLLIRVPQLKDPIIGLETIMESAPSIDIVKILLKYNFPLIKAHLPPFLKEDIGFDLDKFSLAALYNDNQFLDDLLKAEKGQVAINLEPTLFLSIIRGLENILKVLLNYGYLGNFDCLKIIDLILLHAPGTKKTILLTTLFNSGHALTDLDSDKFYEKIKTVSNLEYLSIMLNNNYCKHKTSFLRIVQLLFYLATEQNLAPIINLMFSTYRNWDNKCTNTATLLSSISKSGVSLLKEAIETTKLFLIRGVLNIQGVDVNEQFGQSTALHYAIELNATKLVELLLEFKANVGILTEKGTPLKLALDLEYFHLAKLLTSTSLSYIADINAAVSNVLEIAFRTNDLKLMQKITENISGHLIESNVNDKFLNLLVSRDHSDIIKCLVPYKINWTNAHGPNVLDLALLLHHINTVKALKNMVKPNVLQFISDEEQFLFGNENSTTYTKLELKFIKSALEGNLSLLKELIEKNGVNINFKTKASGTTALMLAAAKGHSEMVRYLIHKNADITLVNSIKLTAIDLAKLADRTDIINMLKKNAKIFDDLAALNSLDISPVKNRYNFHQSPQNGNIQNMEVVRDLTDETIVNFLFDSPLDCK